MWQNKNDIIDFILAIPISIILIIIVSHFGTPIETDDKQSPIKGFIIEADEGIEVEHASEITFGDGEDANIFGQEQKQEPLIKTKIQIYQLTNTERDLVERVVMGLTEHENITAQKAVAQCILNACIILERRPDYVIEALRYTKYRPTPSNEIKQSVSSVFDDGETILEKDVLYLYNYSQTYSNWHEMQEYVCTIGNYKFFK